jgi:epoxyqueuosine reductase
LAVAAKRLLDDENPLVRGAAVWALSQLLGQQEFEALASRTVSSEADETVRAEWCRA